MLNVKFFEDQFSPIYVYFLQYMIQKSRQQVLIWR